ncbi:hypothetical protein Tco_1553553 [Tanacetum coccineum]
MGNVSSCLTSQPIAFKCKGCLIYLGVDLEPDEWIKDSGCYKHMTGNRKLFSTYKAYQWSNVILYNLRGNISEQASKTSPLVDDDLDEEEAIREIDKKSLEKIVDDETLEIDEIVNIPGI